MMSFVLRLLSTMILLYILAIFVRIILTWFQGPYPQGRPLYHLTRITDPYLNYFKRFTFLRIGQFDFSPVAALILLSMVSNVLQSLALYGKITIGIILALLVSMVWSAIAFFLVLFLVLIVARIVGMLAGANYTSPLWRTLDLILNPVLIPVSKFFMGGKTTTYLKGLLIGGAAFLGLRILGGFIVDRITAILERLPF